VEKPAVINNLFFVPNFQNKNKTLIKKELKQKKDESKKEKRSYSSLALCPHCWGTGIPYELQRMGYKLPCPVRIGWC
jgi:hypothetical protein